MNVVKVNSRRTPVEAPVEALVQRLTSMEITAKTKGLLYFQLSMPFNNSQKCLVQFF